MTFGRNYKLNNHQLLTLILDRFAIFFFYLVHLLIILAEQQKLTLPTLASNRLYEMASLVQFIRMTVILLLLIVT